MEKEIRVYLVELDNYEFDTNPLIWSNEKFISEAEIQGNVYSLKKFQDEWNIENLIINSYIRIL